MGLNFPSSPVENQRFTGNGTPFIYQGGVWKLATRHALPYNYVINGAMQLDQEWSFAAQTVGAGNSLFIADQWFVRTAGSNTCVSSAVTAGPTTPKGSLRCVQLTVTTASNAGVNDFVCIGQSFEGFHVMHDWQYGTASARPLVLVFNFAGPAGTYCATLRSGTGGSNYAYPIPFTVSAGNANVSKEYIYAIPGCTAGVWNADGTGSSSFEIWIMGGANVKTVTSFAWAVSNPVYLTVTENFNTVNNKFILADVGLYLDPFNTGVPPPWEQPEYMDEKVRCQRYFYVTAPMSGSWGGRSTTWVQFPERIPPMRTTAVVANTPTSQVDRPYVQGYANLTGIEYSPGVLLDQPAASIPAGYKAMSLKGYRYSARM